MLPPGGGHENTSYLADIVPQLPLISDVHRVSFKALDRGGDILSTNRGHYDLLNIFYLQPVSGGLVALYADVEIIPAHDPLCEGAGSAWDVLDRALDVQRDLLKRGEVLAEDLYSPRRPYAGREHVYPG